MDPETTSAGRIEDKPGRCLSVLDGIELGVIVADERGNVSYANGKAALLLGVPLETLAGASLKLLRRQRFSHLFSHHFDSALSTGRPVKFEEMPPPPPASIKRLKYSMYPGGPGMVITIEDVSAEWRANEGLRAAALAINKLPDAIFLAQESGLIFHSNETARRITGYERDELTGMAIWEVMPGLDIKVLREEASDSFNAEMTLKTGSGKTLPVEVYINRRTFYNVLQYVVTARDITGRKQAEAEVREARARAELYLDLMGHDINNMHQIALGYLELSRDIPDDGANKEFVDKSIEVLQRSTRLIRNVRKLQKLQDGALQAGLVDVCEELAHVQREYGSVPNKAITLYMNGCEHCHVRANELLHDVFANLVGNAINHTGDRAEIAVKLDVVEEDGRRYCRVAIEDDGPGIPDASKGRIFDRMQKGDIKAKGMGLGLYLVRSLVDSYDGRVWVEDRVSGDHMKGARFVVLLPVSE